MKNTNNKIRKLTPGDVIADIKKTQGNTIFHSAKKWLDERYDIRLNTISQEIESKLKTEKSWSVLNDNDLYVEANEDNINISQNKLLAILRSSYVSKFNPIEEYFNQLPKWNGETDYISRYLSYLKLAKGQNEYDFLNQFKKWIVRSVKCATHENYFNKQAFILSDDGLGQNIGKTSWIRSLCPKKLQDYYTENLTGNDKDDKIQLVKNFIINLDELAGLYKKELTQLKASMSTAKINVRMPYSKTNTTSFRISSFIGSTNETSFLIDQTGSVRWICFVINDIDFNYSKEENIDDVWAQAFALSKDKNFNPEMTREEIQENESRNKRFYSMSKEEELLMKYFEIPKNTDLTNIQKLTATEILAVLKNNSNLNLKANAVQMGKYLTRFGFNTIKSKGIKKYLVKDSI
ncbi:VapE domain-containing protein [Nonlabens ulvanivorans]|uniref:VapE domain-containing protein n=1 Tax=Nonlabens ulvanivorans TaxID=906888 RepID=UPI0037C6BE0D